MIKLNCGISRKVGEPNYGSRGASVNVELELESSAVQDSQLLHQKIRGLFAVAKAAVDQELGLTATSTASQEQNCGAGNASDGGRPATEPQLRAIVAICRQHGLDAESWVREKCGRLPRELTLVEASRLIDELKRISPSSQ